LNKKNSLIKILFGFCYEPQLWIHWNETILNLLF